jgi:hypothetical protein
MTNYPSALPALVPALVPAPGSANYNDYIWVPRLAQEEEGTRNDSGTWVNGG